MPNAETVALPGLKEDELRKLAICRLCGEKVFSLGFAGYRVSIEQIVLDRAACDRQTGLAMLLGGNGVLARVMGPDEDVAKVLRSARDIAVCSGCMTHQLLAVLMLAAREAPDADR